MKETAKGRRKIGTYVVKPRKQEIGNLPRTADPPSLRLPPPPSPSPSSVNVQLEDPGPRTALQILQTPSLSSLYVSERGREEDDLLLTDNNSKKRKTNTTTNE